MKKPREKQTAEASGAMREAPSQRPRKAIWIAVAIVASALSFALSMPWWRDYGYWPESRGMWAIYFVVGFILAIYVFYTFFGNIRTLFEHDAIERAKLAETTAANDAGDQL